MSFAFNPLSFGQSAAPQATPDIPRSTKYIDLPQDLKNLIDQCESKLDELKKSRAALSDESSLENFDDKCETLRKESERTLITLQSNSVQHLARDLSNHCKYHDLVQRLVKRLDQGTFQSGISLGYLNDYMNEFVSRKELELEELGSSIHELSEDSQVSPSSSLEEVVKTEFDRQAELIAVLSGKLAKLLEEKHFVKKVNLISVKPLETANEQSTATQTPSKVAFPFEPFPQTVRR